MVNVKWPSKCFPCNHTLKGASYWIAATAARGEAAMQSKPAGKAHEVSCPKTQQKEADRVGMEPATHQMRGKKTLPPSPPSSHYVFSSCT